MRRALAVTAMAVLVVVDRLLKGAAESVLLGRTDYPKLDGIVALHYTKNTGASFGIFGEHTKLLALLTGIALLAGLIVLMSGKLKNNLLFTAATLIISGGLGNLYDRVFIGYVVDYIEVLFVRFAVFNFADCLITVGSFLIILYVILDTIREAKKKRGLNS